MPDGTDNTKTRLLVIPVAVVVSFVLDWLRVPQNPSPFFYIGPEAFAPFALHSLIVQAHALFPAFLVGAVLLKRPVLISTVTAALAAVVCFGLRTYGASGEVPSLTSLGLHTLDVTIYAAAGAALGAVVRGHLAVRGA